MKKLFTFIAAVLFTVCLAVPPALACWGWGCQTADGSYSGQAASSDYSQSISNWGWGNDSAYAGASGFTYGSVETHASGLLVAQEAGFATGDDMSNTCTYAYDGDHFSMSGASASTEGSMLAGGEAFGLCCGRETVDVMVQVGGSVYQSNTANEVGYFGGDGVGGGSESGAGFTATNYGSDKGGTVAAELEGISGGATTTGGTFVTIDPDGANQSLFGTTNASSEIEVCGCPDSYQGSVFGNGGVSGGVSNGLTFGQASANFNYTGSQAGSGAAAINVNIYNGGNYSSVNVSGSSYAVGN